jgi:cell wall-associated NlpC family hydrolase
VLRTFAFSEPSIKSTPVAAYSLNALVTPTASEGRFVKDASGGWFINAHLSRIGDFDDEPVAVAERFVGVPYLWGGNDSLGLDCSGLVQQAMRACGKACPRDSDQQQALGAAADPLALRRGDLVFWTGHVGMMLDRERLIHANAFHMQVSIEPLAEAVARAGEPNAYRRP